MREGVWWWVIVSKWKKTHKKLVAALSCVNIGMNGVRADYRFERMMKVQEIKIINKERRNNKKEELT